jgi:transposase
VDHVGIDLHKMESQICVLRDGAEPVEIRIRTAHERFERVLAPYLGARVLLEASTESEWVAQWLEDLGHQVVVADPNYAPMYAHRSRRIKTDRRDARALAEASRVEAYRVAHRTSAAQRQVRHRLTVREVLVRARGRAIVVVRSLYRQAGVRIRTGAAESFPRRIAEVMSDGPLSTTVLPLLEVIADLTRRIQEADRQLEDLARHDPVVERLRSVPGVGPVTALGFVAAVDGAERFESAHQLESYLGLVPRERSSGETQRRGRISKAGSSRVRWLLVEAAWRIQHYRREDLAPLQRWTRGIQMRRGRRIATVALARRLAGILYALWRDGTTYDPRHLGHRTA